MNEKTKRKPKEQFNTLIRIGYLLTIILAIPVILNYTIFSWGAKGVQGNLSDWFSFLGNYLGLIGAVSIALLQMRRQKDRDIEQDIESKRSYVVAHNFEANLKLDRVKTHQDSRILETEAYKKLLHRHPLTNDVKTSFLRLVQYGNSPVILDCKISVDTKYADNTVHKLRENIGVMEHGVEFFVPVVPPHAKLNEDISVELIVIEYKTLINEALKFVINHETNKEYYCSVDKDGIEHTLFEQEISKSSWTFPNKTEKRK